ncbi:MAG: M28 family peptidase, partial [Acidobacteriota bacterium]
EQGLLGSEYYAAKPVYPLAKTLAAINMDGWNVAGRTKDLTLVGLGASDLDDYVRRAAAEQGRTVHGDAEPEKGFYYRSDHFSFAKRGVPALSPEGGVDYLGKPDDYGRQVRDEWTTNRYHKPADTVRADWDLAGTREDLKVYFAVGERVAQAAKWPEWKPGNEFKAIRDAMLAR